MIVPGPIPFSSVPVAGVYSQDATTFYMKTDVASAVNLFTGATATGIPASTEVTYFAGAQLLL